MPSNALIKFCPVAKEHAKGLSLIFLLFFLNCAWLHSILTPPLVSIEGPLFQRKTLKLETKQSTAVLFKYVNEHMICGIFHWTILQFLQSKVEHSKAVKGHLNPCPSGYLSHLWLLAHHSQAKKPLLFAGGQCWWLLLEPLISSFPVPPATLHLLPACHLGCPGLLPSGRSNQRAEANKLQGWVTFVQSWSTPLVSVTRCTKENARAESMTLWSAISVLGSHASSSSEPHRQVLPPLISSCL